MTIGSRTKIAIAFAAALVAVPATAVVANAFGGRHHGHHGHHGGHWGGGHWGYGGGYGYGYGGGYGGCRLVRRVNHWGEVVIRRVCF
jgi:opacity protein-like surface antigen